MRSGSYPHYGRIEQRTVTGQNSMGEDVTTWAPVMDTWCLVKYVEGVERDALQQKWDEARYKITMRGGYGQQLNASMRFVWLYEGNNKVLQLINVGDPGGSTRAEATLIARDYDG